MHVLAVGVFFLLMSMVTMYLGKSCNSGCLFECTSWRLEFFLLMTKVTMCLDNSCNSGCLFECTSGQLESFLLMILVTTCLDALWTETTPR